jgi:hypothetical protein
MEDFGRYLHLPRLQNQRRSPDSIREGLALLTWEQDGFAYAENYDDSATRYRGLRAAAQVPIGSDDTGLLVRPRWPDGRSTRKPPRPCQ